MGEGGGDVTQQQQTENLLSDECWDIYGDHHLPGAALRSWDTQVITEA